ncbi:IclR family transcriptional regulator C-terminal domain-containing protein [Tropicibacter sp. Alg240-R139]|uniref:IclR family transcriptional regulator domain-containing protein n=1 Tax=Tropicibacter sp. Alg240-R139 TaxID=2305991 RepID=UPI0013E0DC92|nr:IclR family transcriptional regulator C-terminal domain-containing protein [Tropicibacter sp. Alg240-R139]
MTKKFQPVKEVRAVNRALALLDAMGESGWMTPTDMANATSIDRSTIYRLLVSLVNCGYVVRREQDGRFFLSKKIRYISRSILVEDDESLLVSPALARLTKHIYWPSDYGTVSGGQLTIVDSSHHHTTMTFFRNVVGETRPIFRTALGKAIFAGMNEDERGRLLAEVEEYGGQNWSDANQPGLLNHIVNDFEKRGYALSIEEATPRICAIALPVYRGQKVAGAVNVVVFRAAFNPAKAEEKFFEPLQKAVREIELAFETASAISEQSLRMFEA